MASDHTRLCSYLEYIQMYLSKVGVTRTSRCPCLRSLSLSVYKYDMKIRQIQKIDITAYIPHKYPPSTLLSVSVCVANCLQLLLSFHQVTRKRWLLPHPLRHSAPGLRLRLLHSFYEEHAPSSRPTPPSFPLAIMNAGRARSKYTPRRGGAAAETATTGTLSLPSVSDINNHTLVVLAGLNHSSGTHS